MNDLKLFIKNKDWKSLSEKFSIKFLVENLSLVDCLLLSKILLENEDMDNDLQTYAINLIKCLRKFHLNDWNWRYDAYLGYAYDLRGWDYEEQFDAYKRAADNSVHPDPEVLMRMAINWSCPGVYKSKIDEKKAIELLEIALKDISYIEGVSCLVDLYDEIGEMEKKNHWKKILEESEKKKLYAPYAFLDFFKKLVWEKLK